MADRAFFRWTGLSLAAGGILTLLISTALTPFLPTHGGFVTVAASPIFFWRQIVSAVSAVLLLFGSIGVYLRQSGRARLLGAFAFVVAFIGTALLLATEWSEIFLVRDLAIRAPDALRILDDGHHPTLYDLGALIPLVMFTVGWMATAAWTLRVGMLSRRAPWLVIVGLFSIPILGAAAGLPGQIVGTALLACGWVLLGLDVARIDDARVAV